MNKLLARVSVVLAGVAATAALSGCDSVYPRPSEDAVYYFVANERADGKMRICWPEGQKYALAIAGADAKLQAELEPLRDLVSYKSEWDADDPRWIDAKAVDEHVDELKKLAGEGAEKRSKALEELRKALDADPPEGLSFADDQAREAFRKRLWDALDFEGEPLDKHIARYEGFLEQRLRLFSKVKDGAKSLVKDADALKFDDEALQSEVDAMLAEWNATVSAERERFFKLAETRLAEIASVIKTLDKQKQRDKYNLLDNQRTYYRKRLKAMARGLRELITVEQDKIAECNHAAKIDKQAVELHERRLERSKDQLVWLETRFKSVLKQHEKPR